MLWWLGFLIFAALIKIHDAGICFFDDSQSVKPASEARPIIGKPREILAPEILPDALESGYRGNSYYIAWKKEEHATAYNISKRLIDHEKWEMVNNDGQWYNSKLDKNLAWYPIPLDMYQGNVLTDGTYIIKVEMKKKNIIFSNSITVAFPTQQRIAPPTFQVESYIEPETGVHAVIATWEHSTEITSYNVRVSKKQKNGKLEVVNEKHDIIENDDTDKLKKFKIHSTGEPGMYFVEVAAKRKGTVGAWSKPFPVIINSLDPVEIMADDSQYDSHYYNLVWKKTAGFQTYMIRVTTIGDKILNKMVETSGYPFEDDSKSDQLWFTLPIPKRGKYKIQIAGLTITQVGPWNELIVDTRKTEATFKRPPPAILEHKCHWDNDQYTIATEVIDGAVYKIRIKNTENSLWDWHMQENVQPLISNDEATFVLPLKVHGTYQFQVATIVKGDVSQWSEPMQIMSPVIVKHYPQRNTPIVQILTKECRYDGQYFNLVWKADLPQSTKQPHFFIRVSKRDENIWDEKFQVHGRSFDHESKGGQHWYTIPLPKPGKYKIQIAVSLESDWSEITVDTAYMNPNFIKLAPKVILEICEFHKNEKENLNIYKIVSQATKGAKYLIRKKKSTESEWKWKTGEIVNKMENEKNVAIFIQENGQDRYHFQIAIIVDGDVSPWSDTVELSPLTPQNSKYIFYSIDSLKGGHED